MFGKLKQLGSVLAEGALIGGLIAIGEKTIDFGKNLVVTSQQVGISTDALYMWQSAAKLSGVEAEDFTTSLRFLQRHAYEASQGLGEGTKAFKALGVNVKDHNGNLKDGDQLLRDMADGFERIHDPAKRVALAQQLLGRSGARLLPVLKDGSKGVDEFRTQLEELGISFDTDWTEKAEKAHQEQIKFGLVLQSLSTKIGMKLIPLFIRFFGTLSRWVGLLNKSVQGTQAIQAALVVLGAVATVLAAKILIAFAPLILSTLAWAAGLTLAILLVDDILTLFQGGDSIIGRWIDDQFGAGTASEWVKDVKQWWDDLIPVLEDAWHWFKDNILPSTQDVAASFKALADDIGFVVEQFRHLSEFKEGISKLGHDLGTHLGLADETKDEKMQREGAAFLAEQGIGENITRTPGAAGTARGGNGFFANFDRYGGRPPEAAAPPPGTIGPPPPPGMNIKNEVNVNVAANARPDAQLTNHIKNAVQEGLDQQNRKIVAGVQGG